MRFTVKELGWKRVVILGLGILALLIILLAAPAAAKEGAVSAVAVVFGVSIGFLFLAGCIVFPSVHKRGRASRARVLLGLLALCLMVTLVMTMESILIPGSFVLNLPWAESGTLGWALSAIAVMTLVMIILSSVLVIAACGMLWIQSDLLALMMPRLVERIRRTDFMKGDNIIDRLACWLVDIPKVLDTSTVRLDPKGAYVPERRRWLHAMAWQMVLGLLLAVYVSLNPMLLETMTFADTFTVILLGSVLIPFLILPWSTLEALGISVKGVRHDFFLHDGAKARLLQTLVALGTIFLLIRIALQQVGAETIIARFASYSIVLFLLCALVTFVYFNYFEDSIVGRIRRSLIARGIPALE
jgi:hypothetical protein